MPAKTATALSSAAQKAWATRRARAALAASVAVISPAPSALRAPTTIEQPAPVAKPVVIIRDDKAWMAPRTAAQVAKAVSAVDVFVPVEGFQMVELFVDDAIVGCGFRRFVVLEQSDRMVRLFSVPKLAAITVDRKHFEKHAQAARKVRRPVLADILRRNRAMVDRVNNSAEAEIMNDGGAYADRALALLDGLIPINPAGDARLNPERRP